MIKSGCGECSAEADVCSIVGTVFVRKARALGGECIKCDGEEMRPDTSLHLKLTRFPVGPK